MDSFLFSLLGLIGFFLALNLRARVKRLENAQRALEMRLRDLFGGWVDETPPPAAPPAEPAAADSTFATPDSEPIFGQERSPNPPPVAEAAPRAPQPPSVSIEQEIGTRWAVYVGGVALALGGLLLVRYAIEQGWFGPAARVLTGLALSALLIGAGEYLRRREKNAGEPTPTPAVLSAAGITAGFGAIYAAHALYGFIGPAVAFAALGAFGLGAMLAAVWHGPAIAGLGLIGALIAPLLVQAAEPSPWPLLVYVGVVAAAGYGLARLRQWAWLALAAVFGAAFWGLGFAFGEWPQFPQAAEIHFVLQMALACFAFALDRAALAAKPRNRMILAHAGPLGLALVAAFALAVCVDRGGFDDLWIASAAGLVGLLAVSGAARPRLAAGLLAGAGLTALYLLMLWPAASDLFDLFEAPPDLPFRFKAFAVLSAAVVGGLAGDVLWRRVEVPKIVATLLAATSALSPLLTLCIVYLRLTLDMSWSKTSAPLALAAGVLALVFLAAAGAFGRRDAEDAHDRLALGVFASATLAALALGQTFVLDRGMLTVAFALSALGAAFVESRLDIPALRRAVAATGFVVAARLFWDPRIVGEGLGAAPIFNWLLWGYGVPALSFGLAARFLARNGGEDAPTQISETLATLFATLLVFFQIRHVLHRGDLFAKDVGLVESGLYAISAMGFSLVLARMGLRRASPMLEGLSLGFGVGSAAIAASALAFRSNPYFTGSPIVGGLWFNGLLLGYALPGLCAVLFANLSRADRPLWFQRMLRLVALLLAFLYVTLETRRIFQGACIDWLQPASASEQYAYSAVWLALGVALLGYGLLRHSLEARAASAAVIVLAVLKVFLFDLAHLVGAQRAFSFIGLGAVLIGIGLVYQKLVFRPRKTPDVKS
ncbi:DUF2339 domain-containing protein [Rhodoblastus sp.]|uniref:DUF2339 domain-containing protein n=1 Tax=Rhodoblastus sp. TaxID=1962975 RepID=UPI002604948A|nr:DUF2339 domain-containing protein [Rhodoblastus sp.]